MTTIEDKIPEGRDKSLSTNFRDVFRQTLDIKNIHALPKWLVEDGLVYRPVIYTYKHDPERISKFIERGWDFVVADANDIDDRSAATKAEKNVRAKPVECKYSSGHKAVWMKITQEKLAQREVEKRKERIQQMVQCGQISATDSGYKILGPEYKVNLEKDS